MVDRQNLVDSVGVVVIIAIIVLSDEYLLGIVALLLLRILSELVDIRQSLAE